MNIIGQIDPSAFPSAQRMHHREDELTAEFPSSVTSRRMNLLALRAQNWRAAKKSGPTARDYVQDGLVGMYDAKENAGWGVHDDSSLVDLIGNIDLTKDGTGIIHGDNYIDFTGSGMFDGADALDSSMFVEMVVDFENYADVCFFNYTTSRLQFGRYQSNQVLTQTKGTGFGGVTFAGAMTYSFGTSTTRFINGSRWSTAAGDYWGGRSGTTPFALGGTVRTGSVRAYSRGRFHCLRIYNRVLTVDEVAANYAVDKERFGLT